MQLMGTGKRTVSADGAVVDDKTWAFMQYGRPWSKTTGQPQKSSLKCPEKTLFASGFFWGGHTG